MQGRDPLNLIKTSNSYSSDTATVMQLSSFIVVADLLLFFSF